MTNFFILAGGLGTRAEPLSSILPKPLFPLGGKPLLKLLAEQLKSNRFRRGFINVHHKASMITDFPLPGLDTTYLKEETLSGNRILSTIGNYTNEDLLVINGDTYIDIPCLQLQKELDQSGSDGVILVRKKDGVYSSIITHDRFFKKRDKDPEITDIMYAGVSIFKNSFLKKLRSENLFDSLEKSGGSIRIIEYNKIWLDLGTPENYFHSNAIFREKERIHSSNSLSDDIFISDNAEVINSIIWNNTKISGHTTIRDSIVTGNQEIREKNFLKKIVTEKGIFNLSV